LIKLAKAKFVLDNLQQDTSAIEQKILENVMELSQEGIMWFVQLDTDLGITAECEISYFDSSNNVVKEIVNIDEYNKITSLTAEGGEPCFEIHSEPYWIKTSKQNCINNRFVFRCYSTYEGEYELSVFYTKDDEVLYLTGISESATLGEPLEKKFSFGKLCIGKNSCDYEATLWFALDLERFSAFSEDYSAETFIPYLVLEKDSNKKLFNDAFLYELTGDEFYITEAEKYQQADGSWNVPSSSKGKFFDAGTSALVGIGNIDNSKNYLLSQQSSDGKFNNLKDTSWILWNFWPRGSFSSECKNKDYSCVAEDQCTGNKTKTDETGCEIYNKVCCRDLKEDEYPCKKEGYNCVKQGFCQEYNGVFIEGLQCKGINEICCDGGLGLSNCENRKGKCKTSCLTTELKMEGSDYKCSSGVCCLDSTRIKCSDLKGEVCISDEKCLDSTGKTKQTVISSDSASCCIGECKSSSELCQSQGGVKCSPTDNKVCLGDNWFIAIDEKYCCDYFYCQDKEEEICYDLGGVLCLFNEECENGELIITSDGSCCIQGGSCVSKQTCRDLNGQICDSADECSSSGSITQTSDAEFCCVEGKCLSSCNSLGGKICSEGQHCVGDYEESSDAFECCFGQCKKEKPSFNFFWIILLLISVLVIVVVVLLYKKGIIKMKGKKPKENKPIHPAFNMPRTTTYQGPVFRGPMPMQRPMRRPVRQQTRTTATKIVEKPKPARATTSEDDEVLRKLREIAKGK